MSKTLTGNPLVDHVRLVKNFPKPGINFVDVSSITGGFRGARRMGLIFLNKNIFFNIKFPSRRGGSGSREKFIFLGWSEGQAPLFFFFFCVLFWGGKSFNMIF